MTSVHEGVNIRDKFIGECQNNPQRFEEAISKQKISNFATESLKKKNKSNQVAIISNVKGTRDLFGRLLYLALRSLLDLNIVFQYPLLPEPPCFTHPDGSLRESKKSTVFHFLKNKVTFIADGLFIVRSSNNLKNATFSSFARSILTKLLKCTKYRLDLCFDVYESPSIKDVKRKARGDNEVDCYFTFGPKQSLPSDFEALLQISEYKT